MNSKLKQLKSKVHTTVIETSKRITVRYHETNIAVIDTNIKAVTLNAGSWKTATTKNRINEVLTILDLPTIYQKSSIWYIGRNAVPFRNRIVMGYKVEL